MVRVQAITSIAFPLVSAALWRRESARDIAVGLARKKPVNDYAVSLAGRMDTALQGRPARPSAHDRGGRGRRLLGGDDQRDDDRPRAGGARTRSKAVELALELAGGAGFYRVNGLERRFRDIQGVRFHPLQQGPQTRYAGSLALGQPVDTVF